MAWFADRLANLVSGLGGVKDKTTANVHVYALREQAEIDAAYRQNWIVKKANDIIPFDMLREWRQWQAEPDQVSAIEAAETALGYRNKLLEALKRARKDGGAAIVIGDGSTDVGTELRADRIGRGGIKYLHVLSRYDIIPARIEADPLSPWFGQPISYQLRGASAQAVLHPSRVIRFIGAPILDHITSADGWGDSIHQSLLDAFDQATSSAAYVAAMLPEAKQDIIHVPGLSDTLSTAAGTAKLTERFAYANQMKSMFGMLLLEGDGKSPDGELYTQKQLSFAGLPEVVRLFLQIASGAADIPVTRFLSQSAAGLNATGEGDANNYRDHITSRQNVELRPTIAPLDEMLIRHALGERPSGIWYNWNPIYQPSDKEKSEVGERRAKTMSSLVRDGLVPEPVAREGVKGWLINDDSFPGIEGAYRDYGDLNGDADVEPFEEDEATNVVPLRRQAVQDAEPRSLYVSRKVENAAEILAWARAQGFTKTLDASDLHVTIAYSRDPVDWFAVGTAEDKIVVPRGGPRQMERFGDATVLLFSDWSLRWRHEGLREAGASWDHEQYQTHVTISYDAQDIDLSTVEPYQGKIVFGPEVFTEVDED